MKTKVVFLLFLGIIFSIGARTQNFQKDSLRIVKESDTALKVIDQTIFSINKLKNSFEKTNKTPEKSDIIMVLNLSMILANRQVKTLTENKELRLSLAKLGNEVLELKKMINKEAKERGKK